MNVFGLATVLFSAFATRAPHPWQSVAVLILSGVVLLYLLHAFAHARLLSADMAELDRLHQEGLLSDGNSIDQDYQTISYLLNTIAPAVYMRQEIWIRIYYRLLQMARLAMAWSSAIEREMLRLAAYQAAHYRQACARLSAIRTE